MLRQYTLSIPRAKAQAPNISSKPIHLTLFGSWCFFPALAPVFVPSIPNDVAWCDFVDTRILSPYLGYGAHWHVQ